MPVEDLPQRIGLMGDLSEFADELEPAASLLSIFSMQPDMKHVHIIVKVPAAGVGK